jgi:hypothetical protein
MSRVGVKTKKCKNIKDKSKCKIVLINVHFSSFPFLKGKFRRNRGFLFLIKTYPVIANDATQTKKPEFQRQN